MAIVLDPAVAYELWAETYPAEAHNPLMTAEQAIVARIIAHVRAKRALDVGTGSGRYLPILGAAARTVVGVDLSMAMLRRGPGHHCVRADARVLPFRSAAFDLVNASLMVGDVADVRVWTREMARVLSTAGHLVYSDFHPSWTELGWQRTFRANDGMLRTIRFVPHSIDEHLSALAAAGLSVAAIREPRLAVRGISTPVLAIFHAVKTGPVLR
jgi:malonyl-CoA O-methyltransferase